MGKQKKIYYFYTSYFTGWRPKLRVYNYETGREDFYDLYESTYHSFVSLANSGDYIVRITDEEGVAWEMERR